MSKQQDGKGLGIRPGQVISAALAAVTAAVLGSTMGVAGTVLGAGVASVVTTVAGALYLRSLDRTKAGVRLVRERVRTSTGGQVIIEKEITEDDAGEPEQPRDRPPRTAVLRWGAIAAASVLAFALGMLAITGYEKLTGGSLSGGTGTTFGSVIHPRPPVDQRREGDAPAPTTTPAPTPSTVTVTVPADPTTTSGSTAPTTSGSIASTTPPDTTTSEPPPTTTTAPSGDVPSQ